jgi:hypothetical protein
MIPAPRCETPKAPPAIRGNPRFADCENHLISGMSFEVTGAES